MQDSNYFTPCETVGICGFICNKECLLQKDGNIFKLYGTRTGRRPQASGFFGSRESQSSWQLRVKEKLRTDDCYRTVPNVPVPNILESDFVDLDLEHCPSRIWNPLVLKNELFTNFDGLLPGNRAGKSAMKTV